MCDFKIWKQSFLFQTCIFLLPTEDYLSDARSLYKRCVKVLDYMTSEEIVLCGDLRNGFMWVFCHMALRTLLRNPRLSLQTVIAPTEDAL